MLPCDTNWLGHHSEPLDCKPILREVARASPNVGQLDSLPTAMLTTCEKCTWSVISALHLVNSRRALSKTEQTFREDFPGWRFLEFSHMKALWTMEIKIYSIGNKPRINGQILRSPDC